MKTLDELSVEIELFLAKHGKIDVNSPSDWNSPDAYALESVQKQLREGIMPERVPHSEWGSGGYGPYTDEKGKRWHNQLLEDIKLLIKESKCTHDHK
jgi:hypothetical protein